VVSTTDPYGRILGFLDLSRYFVFQVAPQLYSQGSEIYLRISLSPNKTPRMDNSYLAILMNSPLLWNCNIRLPNPRRPSLNRTHSDRFL
jgi:hypothetical protein